MRQTSTEFMDEMLKDNSKPQDAPDLSKQIAEVIDKKMEQAMKKFEEQVSKVVSPNNETETEESQYNNISEEDSENEEQGSKEDGETDN